MRSSYALLLLCPAPPYSLSHHQKAHWLFWVQASRWCTGRPTTSSFTWMKGYASYDMWHIYLRRHSGQCGRHLPKAKYVHGKVGPIIFAKKKCAKLLQDRRRGGIEGTCGKGWRSALNICFFAFVNNEQPYIAACSRIIFITVRSLLPWTFRHHTHPLTV